jgi:predicted metal-dependent hydrolase
MSRFRETREDTQLNGEDVFFLLRRSPRRRTLALRVSEKGEVVVNAPQRLAMGEIHRFLHKHAEWLHGRRREAREQTCHWDTGDSLPYLGEFLTLGVDPKPGKPLVWREGEALICSALPDQVEATILRWYRHEALRLLADRLAHWSGPAGRASIPAMRLSNARTRWGSLSPKGVVSLNWRLIKASEDEIDYVICHELAHFRQRNHSSTFWREVESLFPAWTTVRRRLRDNGRTYFQF